MRIRKIPLNRRPYIQADGAFAPEEGDETRLEDPQVQANMNAIRSFLLADRTLHDQVSFYLWVSVVQL